MSVAMASIVSAPVARVAGRRTSSAAAARRVALVHPAGLRPARLAVRMQAVEKKEADVSEELNTKATELLETAKTKWDETEEKPAVIAISVVSFIAIWASAALVEGIDRLPLLGSFFELVGLIVTGWFVYRYLLFGPDREELKKNIDSFLAKVAGK